MSQPPLKAIQCFCLAAQHLSFKKAAREMTVTPGAVSQQIKLIENWLGLDLFQRRARSIVLTEAGNAYYRRIAPLMNELIGINRSLRQIDRLKMVRIALPPAFALLCLGARLPEFRASYPDIELRLQASSLLYSLQGTGNDLAIRYLMEPDEQLDCTLLARLEVFPVCSPAYLAAHPALARGELHGVTLLHDTLHPDWHRLGQAHDLTIPANGGLYFDQAVLTRQAAENELGLALGDRVLYRDALDAGRLVTPFDASISARRHLYLAHAGNPLLSPSASLVKAWIIETFRDPHPGASH